MNQKTKECYFCVNNLEADYKDVKTLKRFVNFYQKIISAQRTGTCAWHQRKLTQAVKRSRQVALLGFTHK
jgi:small subunit ribosomal protein S18